MIEIVQAARYEDERAYWACWLELSQDSEMWWLPATAPGSLSEGELLAHFEAKGLALWRIAQAKKYLPDLHAHIPASRVLRAFVTVVLDELNILREAAGLSPRTIEQLRRAIKNKMGGIA